MEINMDIEKRALLYLPERLKEGVLKTMSLYSGMVTEIRLRADNGVFITANEKNIPCNIIPTFDEISKCVRRLAGNSLYSHSETIKEGYISAEGGIRAGICGRAVCNSGTISTVCDITSVCIRIPHRVKGAGDGIVKLLIKDKCGILIISKPGCGKTTVLREIAAVLSSAPFNLRTSVIDTRCELCAPLKGEYSIDILSAYPRAKGIETALRTLSPELIICDEIGSYEDSEAIYSAFGSGVPVIASAHAGSSEEILKRPFISKLLKDEIFKYIALLKYENGKRETEIVNIKELCLK